MAKDFQKITKEQCEMLKEHAKENGGFFAEIDGRELQTLDAYLSAVWEVFQFPKEQPNYYAYMDWIRDLDWLNANRYGLAIHHFDELLKQSSKDRKIIVEGFQETIFPWWEGEIVDCVVGGKPKPFDVYLVEG